MTTIKSRSAFSNFTLWRSSLIVSGALAASFATGCVGDEPAGDAALEVELKTEATNPESPFAHKLDAEQQQIFHQRSNVVPISGSVEVLEDPENCLKQVTRSYQVQFQGVDGTTSGVAGVSCTATCHGENCVATGCTPDGNGSCTANVSCDASAGCSDASCSTTTTSNTSIYDSIVEVQGAT